CVARRYAVVRLADCKARLLEIHAHEGRDARLILDDEDGVALRSSHVGVSCQTRRVGRGGSVSAAAAAEGESLAEARPCIRVFATSLVGPGRARVAAVEDEAAMHEP